MQLRRQDNVNYVAIGDNTVDATAPSGTLAASANVTDGDVVLIDEDNKILEAADYTALAADRKVRVAQVISLANQKFIFSPAMTKSSITTSMKGYTAPDQQVTRIGYNGTTGALPTTTVKTGFFIKIRKNDNDAANRSQPNSLFAQFQTDATGSQEELALGLVKSGIQNMSTQPAGNNGYVKFEMLNAGARTAATATGVVTLTFTKDSTLVTASAATASTNIVAGDYVAIAAATTSGVYKVKSKDGSGNLTLETAYQSATTTIVASAANIRIANAAAVAAASGVQLTGIVSDFDVDAFRNYYSNRFTATFSDTSTLNTHVTGAKDGNGVWQQVAMDEYMSMGNQGENSMLGTPPVMRTKTFVEGGTYSSLMIESNEDIQGLTAFNRERSSVLVYGQRTAGNIVTNTSAFHLAAVLGAGTLPA